MSPVRSRPDPRRRRSLAGRRRLRGPGSAVAALLVGLVGCGPGEGVGEPAATSSPQTADSAALSEAVTEMLRSSAGAWNAGDLDGFLDDYSTDPGLTFVGSSGVVRGREGVRARYLRSYWAEGVERDSLRFEGLEVRPLGGNHALTLGEYVLYRPAAGDSITARGPFTLVLRREGDEWKIIHDHSS